MLAGKMLFFFFFNSVWQRLFLLLSLRLKGWIYMIWGYNKESSFNWRSMLEGLLWPNVWVIKEHFYSIKEK